MDISKLFRWTAKVILKDLDGMPLRDANGEPVWVYIRIVGDNDLDTIRKYALKESRKARKAFTEDIDYYLPDLGSLKKEELISLILLGEMTEIYKQAERDTEINYPSAKDSLTLEQEEELSEKLETYFDRLHEAVLKNTNKLLEERRQHYNLRELEFLLPLAQKRYIDKMAEVEMSRAHNDGILRYAIFKDEEFSIPAFTSFEEAANASAHLKGQLIEAYTKLSLKDTELKK